MSRRKDKIITFFSNLLENTNEVNFESVIQESLVLFEEITHIMQKGTEEEQKEIQDAMDVVNQKVTEQFDTLCDEYGISKDDVRKLMNNPNNFSPEVTDLMKKLQTQVEMPKIEEVKSKKNKRKPTQWVSA